MNKGHDNLIADLKALLARAEAGEFNDFGSVHPTPKVQLDVEFRRLAECVREGRYDQ